MAKFHLNQFEQQFNTNQENINIKQNISNKLSQLTSIQAHYHPDTTNVCLFIDTSLFPTHNPVRTLGVMESERWISLSNDLPTQARQQQHQIVKQTIIKHYQDNPRGLPLWGDIQRYCYCQILSNGQVDKVWFDIEGNVLEII